MYAAIDGFVAQSLVSSASTQDGFNQLQCLYSLCHGAQRKEYPTVLFAASEVQLRLYVQENQLASR